MYTLELNGHDGALAFDEEKCAEAGHRFAQKYQSAEPYPHIAIDDFIPARVLRDLLEEFPDSAGKQYFDRNQERLKYQFHPQDCGPRVRNFLAELNSQAFLSFLSAMTGINGLIADPYFFGGGLHETKRGGHLGVHTDFNIHSKMKVVRRLNLLIYLNDDWDETYGGELELWDRGMTACQHRISPVLGRAVIFNTDLNSFHGHPTPLTCPPERSRRSIATYYYTSPVDGLKALRERGTVFKSRPGSGDRTDWKIIMEHFKDDWTPPAVRRGLFRRRET